MPHLLIEYTGNLISAFETNDALENAHKVMLQIGLFEPDAVKSRAHIAADFLIGERSRQEHSSFIHARVYLLEGRTDAQKAGLSEALFTALRRDVPTATHISVDIRDMQKSCYQKS